MHHRPMRRAALAVACVLLLASAAWAADGATFRLTKQGASGQVYTWQSGSC